MASESLADEFERLRAEYDSAQAACIKDRSPVNTLRQDIAEGDLWDFQALNHATIARALRIAKIVDSYHDKYDILTRDADESEMILACQSIRRAVK